MNDKTPEQTSPVPAESSASAPKPSEPSEPKARNQSVRAPVSKTAILALALSASALAVIAGAGWYGYKTVWPVLTSGTLANQAWVDSQLASSNKSLKGELSSNDQQIIQQVRGVSEQSGRLVSRIDNLDRKLARLQGADRNDWLLAEAEYLMRLANQRILTAHDLKSAQTLLAQANELLIAVDEYGLFNVRQALAEDMASIRGTENIDITGAWLELNALANQIDQLPVISDTLQPETIESSETVETIVAVSPPAGTEPQTLWQKIKQTGSEWGAELARTATTIADAFASQFHIRRTEVTDAPALLSPQQEIFLRQNLRLMIEQAQVALLQGRTEIYRASIKETEEWLGKWFMNDNQNMLAIKQTLKRLSTIPVTQPVPDISRSLVALKGYVNDKISQNLPVEKVETSEGQQ